MKELRVPSDHESRGLKEHRMAGTPVTQVVVSRAAAVAEARVLREWERVRSHPHIAEFCGILVDEIALPAFVRPIYPYDALQFLKVKSWAQIAQIVRSSHYYMSPY